MSKWAKACARAARVGKTRRQARPGPPCRHGLGASKCRPCRREAVRLAGRRFRARQKEASRG